MDVSKTIHRRTQEGGWRMAPHGETARAGSQGAVSALPSECRQLSNSDPEYHPYRPFEESEVPPLRPARLPGAIRHRVETSARLLFSILRPSGVCSQTEARQCQGKSITGKRNNLCQEVRNGI